MRRLPALVLPAFALTAILAAGAAGAQPPAEPTPTPGKAAAEPKKVCRREPAPTGSMMPGKRICKTAAEWSQSDAHTDGTGADTLERLSRSRSTSGN